VSKTLTIRIKAFDEGLEGFRRTYKAVRAGKKVVRDEGVYFTSIEAARNLLTKSRLALLHAIRQHHPRSIYQLAKLVGRNLKNVQTDLQLLERYGLVRFEESKRDGNRRVKAAVVPFDEIAVKIAL